MAVALSERGFPIPQFGEKSPLLEKKIYISPDGKGIDLDYSHFPRRSKVARHERATLDHVAGSKELNEGIKIWIGPNAINKFTSTILFEHIRRPDVIGIGEAGIVLVEAKTTEGTDFENKIKLKVESLPRFVERLKDNSHLFTSNMKVWFAESEAYGDIPWRMIVQPASQTDLVVSTSNEDNEDILNRIGHGEFRSVTHRFVPIPKIKSMAA